MITEEQNEREIHMMCEEYDNYPSPMPYSEDPVVRARADKIIAEILGPDFFESRQKSNIQSNNRQ